MTFSQGFKIFLCPSCPCCIFAFVDITVVLSSFLEHPYIDPLLVVTVAVHTVMCLVSTLAFENPLPHTSKVGCSV